MSENKSKIKRNKKIEAKSEDVENYKDWLGYVDGYEYFVTQDNEVCAKINVEEGGSKFILVRSTEFKDMIRYKSYESGNMAKNEFISNIIDIIEAKARYTGKKIKSFVRMGEYNGKFYYDLGDDEFVEITDESYKIVKSTPLCFLRNDTMLSQCKPKYSEQLDIWKLKEFINVKSEDELKLLVINMISYFIPDIPHHIIILIGNQGSSKSTVCRMIKKLVDPSTVDIYSFPRSKEDLVLHLNNAYLIPYDNLNRIKEEYNDIFCQVATGGNFLKRRLYSDSNLVSYSLKRALILNGINIATDKPDLLDRSIVLHLKTIQNDQRKTESEIFEKFDKLIPYFMDHIFDTVSYARSIYKDLDLKELPRMADAVKWSCAIAEALGISSKEYLDIYTKNQNNINVEIIATNSVADTIIDLMYKKDNWKGSVGALWIKLNDKACFKEIDKDKTWAKTPSQLSRNLNILKTNLEKIGIFYEIRNVGTHKEIEIWNKNVKPKTNIKPKPKSKAKAKSKVTSKKSIEKTDKKRVSKSDLNDLD